MLLLSGYSGFIPNMIEVCLCWPILTRTLWLCQRNLKLFERLFDKCTIIITLKKKEKMTRVYDIHSVLLKPSARAHDTILLLPQLEFKLSDYRVLEFTCWILVLASSISFRWSVNTRLTRRRVFVVCSGVTYTQCSAWSAAITCRKLFDCIYRRSLLFPFVPLQCWLCSCKEMLLLF